MILTNKGNKWKQSVVGGQFKKFIAEAFFNKRFGNCICNLADKPFAPNTIIMTANLSPRFVLNGRRITS